MYKEGDSLTMFIHVKEKLPSQEGIYLCRCVDNKTGEIKYRIDEFRKPSVFQEKYEGIEDEVDKTLLKASIEKLSNRERNIMELRFGFISGNEKTQKEVADMLGISQSYISRLEKKIINKMKKDISSKIG